MSVGKLQNLNPISWIRKRIKLGINKDAILYGENGAGDGLLSELKKFVSNNSGAEKPVIDLMIKVIKETAKMNPDSNAPDNLKNHLRNFLTRLGNYTSITEDFKNNLVNLMNEKHAQIFTLAEHRDPEEIRCCFSSSENTDSMEKIESFLRLLQFQQRNWPKSSRTVYNNVVGAPGMTSNSKAQNVSTSSASRCSVSNNGEDESKSSLYSSRNSSISSSEYEEDEKRETTQGISRKRKCVDLSLDDIEDDMEKHYKKMRFSNIENSNSSDWVVLGSKLLVESSESQGSSLQSFVDIKNPYDNSSSGLEKSVKDQSSGTSSPVLDSTIYFQASVCQEAPLQPHVGDSLVNQSLIITPPNASLGNNNVYTIEGSEEIFEPSIDTEGKSIKSIELNTSDDNPNLNEQFSIQVGANLLNQSFFQVNTDNSQTSGPVTINDNQDIPSDDGTESKATSIEKFRSEIGTEQQNQQETSTVKDKNSPEESSENLSINTHKKDNFTDKLVLARLAPTSSYKTPYDIINHWLEQLTNSNHEFTSEDFNQIVKGFYSKIETSKCEEAAQHGCFKMLNAFVFTKLTLELFIDLEIQAWIMDCVLKHLENIDIINFTENYNRVNDIIQYFFELYSKADELYMKENRSLVRCLYILSKIADTCTSQGLYEIKEGQIVKISRQDSVSENFNGDSFSSVVICYYPVVIEEIPSIPEEVLLNFIKVCNLTEKNTQCTEFQTACISYMVQKGFNEYERDLLTGDWDVVINPIDELRVKIINAKQNERITTNEVLNLLKSVLEITNEHNSDLMNLWIDMICEYKISSDFLERIVLQVKSSNSTCIGFLLNNTRFPEFIAEKCVGFHINPLQPIMWECIISFSIFNSEWFLLNLGYIVHVPTDNIKFKSKLKMVLTRVTRFKKIATSLNSGEIRMYKITMDKSKRNITMQELDIKKSLMFNGIKLMYDSPQYTNTNPSNKDLITFLACMACIGNRMKVLEEVSIVQSPFTRFYTVGLPVNPNLINFFLNNFNCGEASPQEIEKFICFLNLVIHNNTFSDKNFTEFRSRISQISSFL